MSQNLVRNFDGHWVEDIPVPVGGIFTKQCGTCRQRFLTHQGYQGHYALCHILKLRRRHEGARLGRKERSAG